MIHFFGSSHAAQHLKAAAQQKGVTVTEDATQADLVFVSEDTPTDESGKRDLSPIRALVQAALQVGPPVVLTSQVVPGFTRSFNAPTGKLFHQAETLRIKDAMERALNPDYIVIGTVFYASYELLPEPYRRYLDKFDCVKHVLTYEDAEFSKIAVNMMLAAQVDATNRLAAVARKAGASWWHVAEVLKRDKRIGPAAYLVPGRWQESRHLLRDSVTLESLLAR